MARQTSELLRGIAETIRLIKNKDGSSDYYLNFGGRVAELRAHLNLSQEEFSRRYDIPLGTLRHWEQARKHAPAPDTAAELLISMVSAAPEEVAYIVAMAKSARVGKNHRSKETQATN